MLLFTGRSSGPRFSECASYTFANFFLWATVAIAVIGLSQFIFRLDGSNSGGAALILGGILIGLLIAAGTGALLGTLFSLIAVIRFKERARLWPLLVPVALLLVFFLVAASGIFDSRSGDPSSFAEEKSLLIAHAMGYIAVASLAFLWISRLSTVFAVIAIFAFMLISLDNVAIQYWALDKLGEFKGGKNTWDTRIEGEFSLKAPIWIEWLAGDEYKTYRIKADIAPADLIKDARVNVWVAPRLFGTSATEGTNLSLSVDSGRVAVLTVPSFITVTGPGGVQGLHPARERSGVQARIFGDDGATASPWLRTDQVNHLRCTVHDYATGDCEILSQLPEASR